MRLSFASVAAVVFMAAAFVPAIQAQSVCDPGFFCTTEYAPVCGSKGKTYNSQCELEVAQCMDSALNQEYACECNDNGKCESEAEPPSTGGSQDFCAHDVACMAEYDPVCYRFSTGETMEFGNDCQFRVAKCTNPLLSLTTQCTCDGEGGCLAPAEPTPSPSECAAPKFKICATNGNTYADAKAFLTARLMNPTIKFQSIGECGAPPLAPSLVPEADSGKSCGMICTAPNLYKPVCTPKGVIFQHRCFHLQAFCCDGESYPDARVEFCNPLLLP